MDHYLLFIIDSSPTTLSNEEIKDTFVKLDQLLQSVLHQTPNDLSFQVAYELCRTVCLFGQPKKLYGDLKTTLDKHVHAKKDILMGETEQDTFLETLDNHWTTFCEQLVTIRNIFMELDRRYVMPETSYPSLIHLGKQMFRKTIMGTPRIQSKAIRETLLLIHKDRDGLDVDLKRIRTVTQMMVDLSLYDDLFEPSFIQLTIQYYSTESSLEIDKLSTKAYLQHAKNRIQQETVHRIDTYLDKSTKVPLTEAVTHQLIYSKIDNIISQGFNELMDQDEREPLGILYHFVSSHDSIAKLRVAFGNYIKNQGIELLKDPTKDQEMVPTLLQYKHKLDQILNDSFDNNPTFSNTFKENFECFINSRKNKPAEMLAKFFDSKLRSSNKKQAEQDIERLLDKVLIIFRYLQGKDAFEAFYKRFLSKRLLLDRTISNDLEKSILGKIKSECGPDFTKNLESMFKDIDISMDLNNNFKESKEYVGRGNIPLHVNVLAQGVWPTYPTTDIILPTNMAVLLNAYQSFYTSRFKGRKLIWRNSLGSCVVKSHFPKGTKEISVSLFQTIVLLLFNDKSKPTWEYKDIDATTNLDHKELKRVLQSLSCGDHKLLLKQPPNDIIADNDTFAYNSDFTASTVRLKINSIQQEQSVEERKETQTKVLVDRQYQLEAAIVRIMKSKKQMTHVALVNELFVQLKFPIDATDIKKRIESLIDRDYLSRDGADNSLYLYQS
ncbi:cullin-4-like protein [Chlamydoabsidia padenii]|nr:cullin-4-like protein [Chlamydoabsidia padenii]